MKKQANYILKLAIWDMQTVAIISGFYMMKVEA